MKCALHPNIETELRCGKCDQPICPKCIVQTPVGARCPKCAALKKLPVFEISTIFYIRSAAAGLATSAALGAIWSFLPLSGFLVFFITLGIGYAVGEVVSIAANRKRGPGLQTIAGVSVAVSYVVRSLLEARDTSLYHAFVDMWALISLALGIVMAVSLLRRN